MARIDDGEPEVASGHGPMVADVAGDERLGPRGGGGFDEGGPRSWYDGETLHLDVPITGDPEPGGTEGIDQHGIDPAQGALEPSDTADGREASSGIFPSLSIIVCSGAAVSSTRP